MLYVYASILLIFLLFWIFVFNEFIRLNNLVKNALADIDVQLKRRADLIPNIVQIVRTYAKHEKGVFEKVVELRNHLVQAKDEADKFHVASALKTPLKNLLAIAEDYPNLKANENFLSLQKDLTDTENKLEHARRFYNGAVRDYNTKISQLPYNILAALLSFQEKLFFVYSGTLDEKVDF